MRASGMKILQVGLGNFGKRHLEAWHRLGLGDQLRICELDPRKWEQAASYRLPRGSFSSSFEEFLDWADVVDIVTPTQSHFPVAQKALASGKDLFIEKPMTISSGEARQLADMAQEKERIVQVGFYYRTHPGSQVLKKKIAQGRLGALRYLSGNFMGFKRARNDVGVMQTDGIHFLDFFNWLLDDFPVQVYAVCRDHFKRGLEDFSVALLQYERGAVVKVEAGYVQPGRWRDKVVPGARTTKEIMVVGAQASAEMDFETETLTIHPARHELRDGTWTAVVGESVQPAVASCDPVEMVSRELQAFLRCVQERRPASPGPVEGGVQPALLMEAIYESARTGEPVRMSAPALRGVSAA